MRNFDLQIIWSAHTPFLVPGFLALHIQIEAKRSVERVGKNVEKWFSKIEPEKKAMLKYIHLN